VPREIGMALVVLLALVLLALMLVSWRRRRVRQTALGKPAAVPADLGATLLRAEGLYLATTPAGHRLERIAIPPLGFRADAALTVSDLGLVVALTGSDPFFVPKADLIGASRASWTIDRGVEEDGLNLVAWTLHAADTAGTAPQSTALESYFRLREPRAFDEAMATLAPHPERKSA
jgi:hypothetical protein